MSSFAVTVIQPPNYIHSLAFREVGILLARSLISLGHECTLHINEVFSDRINIILGYNLLSPKQIAKLPGQACIFYQLEQLSDREGWYDETQLSAFQSVLCVWDYSKANVEFLKNKGFQRVFHLPIGYHQELEMIEKAPRPDIDVLFYGSVNPRREAVLNQLKEVCRTEVAFGVYGDERDALIARSKIILNLHFYEAQLMEEVRISYLLNNKCFVVSESSPDNPFDEGIATADYERLVETCKRYLLEPKERKRISQAGYRLLRARPMTANISNVLKESGL